MTEPEQGKKLGAWVELNFRYPKSPESIGDDAARYAALLEEARSRGLGPLECEDLDTGSSVAYAEGGEERIKEMVRSLAASGWPCAVDVLDGDGPDVERIWDELDDAVTYVGRRGAPR